MSGSSVSKEQVESWVREPSSAVYFTDGSSRGNPGRAGSAAIRLELFKPTKACANATTACANNFATSKAISPDESKTLLTQSNKQMTASDTKEMGEIQVITVKSSGFPCETNNFAELFAVGLVLEEIGSRAERRIRIMTDSKYVHGLLQLHWNAQKNVQMVRLMRNELRSFRERGFVITFHWVKAHDTETLLWNVIVDRLAVAAALAVPKAETSAAPKAESKSEIPEVMLFSDLF